MCMLDGWTASGWQVDWGDYWCYKAAAKQSVESTGAVATGQRPQTAGLLGCCSWSAPGTWHGPDTHIFSQGSCSMSTLSLIVLTSSGDVMRFSTASTTPSFVNTPIAVEPSCKNHDMERIRCCVQANQLLLLLLQAAIFLLCLCHAGKRWASWEHPCSSCCPGSRCCNIRRPTVKRTRHHSSAEPTGHSPVMHTLIASIAYST
jgi:hypothetical protein